MPLLNTQSSINDPSQNQKIKISPQNWTTARAWRAIDGAGNYTDPKEVGLTKDGQFGHASVETEVCYGSFWPFTRFNKNKTTPVEAGHAHSPDHDTKNEGRKPDLETTFFSLNVANINAEFKKFEEEMEQPGKFKNPGWAVMGSKILNEYKGQNCSGLAFRLLAAGGVKDLSPICAALAKKTVITPNDFFECAQAAKKKELELHPETANFKPEYRHRIA